ncbi:hypothetical protein EPUS_04696 [Endocarpon pusillum Z07020]|uniref:Uncharacterized protein n=1 Tax=Endocarpon pusillum (strain Z07020 / HMAS-L-300199) TaxID=1263415 RepID=U1G9D1_ENDPU|nr:uncharacterized protein EPUS_04696 [Endocarpon pusillum Z07020]ERF68598.1 hypothetical protein EPUS_04696 [Endocarpon pusillum Z07020]
MESPSWMTTVVVGIDFGMRTLLWHIRQLQNGLDPSVGYDANKRLLDEWLSEVGFANYYNRKIRISQTEAEAAAVYAAKQSFTTGNIIIVVDVSGCITDINILEINKHSSERTQLVALNKAEGVNVGSILIDGEAEQLVKQRLHALNVSGNDDDIHWLAKDMLKEVNFEAMKCAFDGSPTQISTIMTIPPEGLPAARQGVPQKIKITAAELRTFFDRQIQIMFESIHHQIRELIREKPNVTVNFIVLSGGLGSSGYVRSCLEAEFNNSKVLCAFEPQLAVAKGLIMDRTQALSRGVVTYGVLNRGLCDNGVLSGSCMTFPPYEA